MSKTLVGILEIGAAIGLQFVPGIGTVTGISIGLSLAASGLTNLFTPGPPRPEGTETAIKSPTPVRMSGYGAPRSYYYWKVA